jgi:TPR repeat protein
MKNLGACYEYGRGVEKNDAEAVKWYKKAAAAGNRLSKDALKRLRKE